jgi:hypothetical protein
MAKQIHYWWSFLPVGSTNWMTTMMSQPVRAFFAGRRDIELYFDEVTDQITVIGFTCWYVEKAIKQKLKSRKPSDVPNTTPTTTPNLENVELSFAHQT